MNDRSVALEKHICRVCFHIYETGGILIHKFLHNIKEDDQITGFGICNEHQKLFEEGHVALVVLNQDKKPTGEYCHVKRSALAYLFDREFPDNLPIIYIEPETFAMLEKLAGDINEN